MMTEKTPEEWIELESIEEVLDVIIEEVKKIKNIRSEICLLKQAVKEHKNISNEEYRAALDTVIYLEENEIEALEDEDEVCSRYIAHMILENNLKAVDIMNVRCRARMLKNGPKLYIKEIGERL